MKRIILAVPLIILIAASMLLAQEEKFPGYSISFTKDKNSGTALFEGRTYDEIWAMVIKVLMLDKYKIAASDKAGGTISAIQTIDDLTRQLLKDMANTEKQGCRWEVFVEMIEGGIQVLFVAQNISNPKHGIRNLCKKIAEKL
jgi:hypothetical protein